MLVLKTLLGNVGSTGPIHHQPCWYPFKPRYLGHITYETSSIINTHKSPSISTSIPIFSIKNGSKTHLLHAPGNHQDPPASLDAISAHAKPPGKPKAVPRSCRSLLWTYLGIPRESSTHGGFVGAIKHGIWFMVIPLIMRILIPHMIPY